MDTNPIRVLLIEDDPDDVLLFKESLTEAKAVKIKMAHADCLSSGLVQLGKQGFDVILLDLNLPDSRGLDTLSSLLRQTSTIPIVVTSGLADDVTTFEAVKQGAQDYLVKGEINDPMLVRVLRHAIERKRAEEALRESEQKYRQLTEQAADGICLLDPDGKFVLVNSRMCEMLGYTESELYQLNIIDSYPPEFREEGRNRLALIQTSHCLRFERSVFRKDGKVFPVEGSAVRLADGRLQGILHDITERKRTEDALRAAEEKYRAIFENSIEGIFQSTPEGRFITVNPAFARMLGYASPQEMIATVTDIARQMYLETPRRAEFVRLMAEQGSVSGFEFQIRRKDGGALWVSENVRAVRDADGRILYYEGRAENISERKQAEAVIEEQAERFRTMMSTISEGFWLVDDKGRLLDVNEAYCRMSAYSKEELLTLSIPDLEAAETPAETAGHMQTTIESGSDLFESRHKTKDGRIFDVEISVAYWAARRQFFVFIQDISERKQAEAAIQRRDRILESLAYAGEQLLISAALEEGLPDMLGRLGKAVEAARVYIFENHSGADGELLTSQRHEWVNAGFRPQMDNPDLQDFHLASNGFSRWIGIMERGGTIHGNIREFPESERDVLSAQEIQSILVVPIFVGGKWWGFIGFDDCLAEREWFAIEIEALKTAASTLGAAIQRKQAEEALGQKARELATLYESAMTVSSNLSLEVVLKTVVEQAAAAINTEGCALSFLDQERDILKTMADYRKSSPDKVDIPGITYSLKDYPATRRALETRQPLFLSRRDPQADPAELALMERLDVGSLLLLPLVTRDRVIGLIELYDVADKERVFTEDELRLAQNLSAQTAIFIDNARLFEQAERRLRRTEALRAIDMAIASSFDLRLTLGVVLDQVTAQLKADAADVLLLDPHLQTLEFGAGRGFRRKAIERSRLRLGEGHAGRAALERKTIHVSELQTRKTDFLRSPSFSQEEFVSYYGVPLVAKGQIKGVLEIFHRKAFEAEAEWLDFLETLAGQAAIAIDNATLFKDLQLSNIELTLAYDATIEGWSHAMDLRDKETQDHTLRVTQMTERLARALGIDDSDLVHIRRGALLHDIGKMGVPDSVLLKADKLTDEEWELMRRHPQFAYDMLAHIAYLRPAMDIPYCHHEKWDGTGYPRGLKGEQIPLAARLFAVVDVYDALTSDRPYRKAWTQKKTLKYIREQSGTHFDPAVVDAFLKSKITAPRKKKKT